MKILMVNKFLYPKGGSETYMFKLGECLQEQGHEVQYFGMEHEGQTVGNRVNAYTSNMDFHGGSKLAKLTYPIKTIYSSEARKKIRRVLDDFQPEVCHLNNFNYQLTPSIILEIRKWEKQTGHKCKIIYTAHDYQLVCPNHMCRVPGTGSNCKKCLRGNFFHCIKNRCIHESLAKSAVGTLEATYWKWMGVYKQIDTIICISRFVKAMMDSNPVFAQKTVVLHNFTDVVHWDDLDKKNYILYFGRFSEEKGVRTLVQAAKELPDIPFVFAGSGPLEQMLENVSNIRNVGFQTGEALQKWIREARLAVCPSEWFEPFGLTIVEAIACGTPVLGANSGGIPELIQEGKTGELFESGDHTVLKSKLLQLWQNPKQLAYYSENCKSVHHDNTEAYSHKLLAYYRGE